MAGARCLPRSTFDIIERCRVEERHPGLLLDKLGIGQGEGPPKGGNEKEGQKAQKRRLDEVCRTRGDPEILRSLLKRRAAALRDLSAEVWSCETDGPLTLHLSRATGLENAGIALHPLYGFLYLPGSGLKGMARAYAETIWSAARRTSPEEASEAWRAIEAVFGRAPLSDRDRPWKPEGIARGQEGDEAHCGAIVFHDAWPEAWPPLIVDIVNNHHRSYYQGDEPPGDWEDPTFVYFLAAPGGIRFSFALSKRNEAVEDRLLRLAKEWLLGGLGHLGAGAKTAAGYGSFMPAEATPPLPSEARATFEATLELATPAFLAGANRGPEDCDLRPATLRGQLRWWWRTLHAGWVEPADLRALESIVWGDVRMGSPVRIGLGPAGKAVPHEFDKKGVRREHRDLERPPTKKTTQGLFYASYGMGEKTPPRWYLQPGTRWKIRLSAREHRPREDDGDRGRKLPASPIPARMILDQAKAALWLFCRFGGAGSKARKGFGSFADLEIDGATLESWRERAREFRETAGIGRGSRGGRAGSSSIEQMLPLLEIPTPWRDCWFAIDQLGYSAQAFAQRYKHRREKCALGLPRRIGEPADGRFPLKGMNRHASPVHYHLARGPDRRLIIRVTIFPSERLPDLQTSCDFLKKLRAHLESDLERRCAEHAKEGQRDWAESVAGRDAPGPGEAPSTCEPALDAGQRVQAILLEERTRKGLWMARHEPTGRTGHIVNSQDVPAEKKPGDRVELIVESLPADRKASIAFRWPLPDEGKGEGRPARRRPDRGRGRR